MGESKPYVRAASSTRRFSDLDTHKPVGKDASQT